MFRSKIFPRDNPQYIVYLRTDYSLALYWAGLNVAELQRVNIFTSFASGRRRTLIPFCHPRDFAPRYAAPLRNHKVLYIFISRKSRHVDRSSRCFVVHSQRRNYTADYLTTWACARHSARRGAALAAANTRRFLISPRRFVPAIHVEEERAPPRREERKGDGERESEVENDAFAASLAATFRCLFLLAFAVHKATREVARNQQPSLSRWQIVERVRSCLSYVRMYVRACVWTRVAFPCMLCALSFFLSPSLPPSLLYSLIRAIFFSPSYVTMRA